MRAAAVEIPNGPYLGDPPDDTQSGGTPPKGDRGTTPTPKTVR